MMHPIEHLAFWKTKPAEINTMIDKYNALAGNDPVLQKQLDDLLAWARAEAVCDELYSNSEQ